MNYWLCITNLENYNIAVSKNVWGVKEKYLYKIEKLAIDDYIVFYILGRRIGGVFKVSSKYFEDRDNVFDGGVYPIRIKIKPIKMPNKLIPLSDKMIFNLEMFTYKDYRFRGNLMGQIIKPISKKDFDYINKKL